jgi:hypothetical protein
MLLVTVYRERAFDKQSSSKIMCDKLRVSAINVFQQPLKCDNEEIDCDVAELDQKTKLILHVIFQSIILLSQFCSLYAKRSILRVSNVPCSRYCMTATAYKLHRRHIKESLGLHNCFELVANSDRKNIFYCEKAFRYRH